MDPEQPYLRAHAHARARPCGLLSQLLTPRLRMALEYACLAFAVALLCLLLVMHATFVQQPGCSREISAIEFTEAQLVQIKITGDGLWTQSSAEPERVYFQNGTLTETSKGQKMNGDDLTILTPKFWSNWLISSDRKCKLILESQKNDEDILEPQAEKAPDASITNSALYNLNMEAEAKDLHVEQPVSVRESFAKAVFHFCRKWKMQVSSLWCISSQLSRYPPMLWKHAGWNTFLQIPKSFQLFPFGHLKAFMVQWLEKKSNAFEPTYLYTVKKGYFLLSDPAKSRHNIRTINVTISAQNSCFGNRWQQLLINTFVGYDTIMMNTILNSPADGYLYNFQTKKFYGFSYVKESSKGPPRFGDYFVTKFGVLVMSLFVFFTVTVSVSFTLRETKSRMLKFTVQLQHHAHNQLPTLQLIFVHVIETLAFVPIMIGTLFFLFELYDDQLLAFFVLALVWMGEFFTMIGVQTAISRQFFPRFFFLYFLVFHIYFFSYPHGFMYLAFSATAAFTSHLVIYFWNRFEVPALQRFLRFRARLLQRTGVQVTQFTFYTSTLHVTSLSMLNRNLVNSEPTPRPDSPARFDPSERSDPTAPVQGSERREVSDLNSQQTGTAAGPNSQNSFEPLLLWMPGGAHWDSLVSSMFGGVQGQDQVYAEQASAQENEPT